MTRLAALALALLLAGVLTSCRAPAPTPTPAPSPTPSPAPVATETYRNSAYEYIVSYPPGWLVSEQSKEEVEIRHPAGLPTLRIMAIDIGAELPVEALLDFVKLTIPLEETSRTQLAENSYELVVSGTPAEVGFAIKAKLRALTRGTRGYLVMVSVPEALYDAFLPVSDPVLSSFTLTGATAAPKPLVWETYLNQAWGYSLSYPQGWRFQSLGDEQEVQFGLELPLALVGVRVDDLPEPLTVDELAPLVLQGFPQDVTTFQEVSRRATTLSGLPALEVRGTFETPSVAPGADTPEGRGVTLELTFTLLVQGQRSYTVWGLLWPRLAEEFGPVLRQATDSFRFTEPAAPAQASPTPTTQPSPVPRITPPPGVGFYQSLDYGWTIAYPLGWTSQEAADGRVVAIAMPAGGIEIQRQELATEASLDAILLGLVPQIQAGFPNFQQISQTRTTRTRESLPALEMMGNFTPDTEKQRVRMVIMVRGKALYTLTVVVPEAEYSRLAPQIDQTLNSFDWVQ